MQNKAKDYAHDGIVDENPGIEPEKALLIVLTNIVTVIELATLITIETER